MTHVDWLLKQSEIYAKFDNGMQVIATTGMKPDTIITEKKGAYFIALRPHHFVSSQISKLVHQAKMAVPSLVVYDTDKMHTTFSDYQLKSNFNISENVDHCEVMKKMAHIAQTVSQFQKPICCSYDKGFVFNQTTCILKGIPNENFLLCAEKIVEEGDKLGLELRLPWGAHLTCARTSEEVTCEKATTLKNIFAQKVLFSGMYPYVSLDAGWFTADPLNGFCAHFSCSFPLA